MNVMVFEGDGVEAAGDFVAFVFWRDEGRGFRSGAGNTSEGVPFCGIGDGSIGEFLADGVDLPDAGLVAELSARTRNRIDRCSFRRSRRACGRWAFRARGRPIFDNRDEAP